MMLRWWALRCSAAPRSAGFGCFHSLPMGKRAISHAAGTAAVAPRTLANEDRDLTVTDLKWFEAKRAATIADLASSANDRSLAGSVDAGVRHIVELVNADFHFVTLSSCSGRVQLFHRTAPWLAANAGHVSVMPAESSDLMPEHPRASDAQVASERRKKRGMGGLGTIFESHSPFECVESATEAVVCEVHRAIRHEQQHQIKDGCLQLKFEPWILHVLCSSLGAASSLIEAASNAGMRRCGLVAAPLGNAGHRKFTVSISTPLGFDTPLSNGGGGELWYADGDGARESSRNDAALRLMCRNLLSLANRLFARNEALKTRFETEFAKARVSLSVAEASDLDVQLRF